MATSSFAFAEAYRTLQPGADRTITSARESAHKAIRAEAAKNGRRLADLARLAFGIPVPPDSALETWFVRPIQKTDSHFSPDMDHEESARIATLVLLDVIRSGSKSTPALVIAASFCGRRGSPDGGTVVSEAKSALADLARDRRLSFNTKMATPSWQSLAKPFQAVASNPDGNNIKAALEAINAEAKDSAANLVKTFNETLGALTVENRRLADEVDLLWWHLGGWSYVLNKPLSDVPNLILPLVIGNDVATMISALPGPHGALGIIKQALGAHAADEQKISETLKAYPADLLPLAVGSQYEGLDGIAPLNYGLVTLLNDGGAGFATAFKRTAKISADTKLTRFEIAQQAYYERVFIKHGWV